MAPFSVIRNVAIFLRIFYEIALKQPPIGE